MTDAPNMNDLLAQAMQMQQALLTEQQAASQRTVEGVAGGGMVRVEVSGTMEFRKVSIDPKVIDPSDPSMLEDLILAALHDSTAKVAAESQAATSKALGGLGAAIPGLGSLGLG